MIGHINNTRRAHIVTVEDPIEVVHDDALSIVQQREVGIDTDSYANALRHVIRQDPDVIFIGEIRDPESALSAIQAAETGHLVISTLHTIDCVETINRLLDLFPPSQQREVRSSFAGSLRGIVAQRLVQRADGKGRVPAVEVLVNTGRVFDRIVDPDETDSIPEVIAEGDYYGMQTFDQALVQLVKEGLVAEDEARRTSTNPHDFDLALMGVMDRRSSTRAAPFRRSRSAPGDLARRPPRADLQRVPPIPVRDREAEVHGEEERTQRAVLPDVMPFVSRELPLDGERPHDHETHRHRGPVEAEHQLRHPARLLVEDDRPVQPRHLERE